MTKWGGEPAQTLAVEILKVCLRQTYDTNMDDKGESPLTWGFEMWANVNPAGAFNQVHAHPQSFWSAVYYVDDGYDGGYSREQGGELVLMDPKFPGAYMYANDVKYITGNTRNVETSIHTIIPSPGKLVVFPSWINHYVKPYYGLRERISIATNLNLTRPSEKKDPQAASGTIFMNISAS